MNKATLSALARPGIFYAVFFVSGCPSLLYQVIWQRVLTLYFGVDVVSTAVTVAIFMFGLGIGALVGGRIADRVERPARAYAICEVALGAMGLASLPVLTRVGALLGGRSLTVMVLADSVLLWLPTMAMGMTLPLMTRAIRVDESGVGAHISRLYGVNALGSAFGAFVSAFFLIGLLGMAGTTAVAAFLNLTLASVVLVSSRGKSVDAPQDARDQARGEALDEPSSPTPLLLAIAFSSGFVALGYEVAWYRVFTLLVHRTAYVFGTILTVYLCGVAWGAHRARRTIDAAGSLARFGRCQLGIAFYVFALFSMLGYASRMPGLRHVLAASTQISFHPAPELLNGNRSVAALYSLIDVPVWAVVLIGPPTFWMGFGFPNLVRAAAGRVDGLGRTVGGLYASNIVGATLGSLATGFIFLHYLKTEGTLALLVSAGALVGWSALRKATSEPGLRRWRYAAVVLAVLGAVVFPGRGRIIRALHYADQQGVEFSSAEDRSGVVAIRRQNAVVTFAQEEKLLGQTRLYIDGGSHGSFESSSGADASSFGDPSIRPAMSARADIRRVLLIGLGDAKMAWALATLPTTEHLQIVELNGALPEMIATTELGRRLLENPKVTLEVDDGRHWLLSHPSERFDAIAMYPLFPAHAYSGNIFSREFMTLVRDRLAESGVLLLNTVDAYATAAAITTVFPYAVRLFGSTYVASMTPLIFEPRIAGTSRSKLLEGLDLDRDDIVARVGGEPCNTDLHPRSEYYLTYAHSEALETWGRHSEAMTSARGMHLEALVGAADGP